MATSPKNMPPGLIASLEYQKQHIEDDRTGLLIGLSWALFTLAAIAVALRLYAQRIVRNQFRLSDALILLGLVSLSTPPFCHANSKLMILDSFSQDQNAYYPPSVRPSLFSDEDVSLILTRHILWIRATSHFGFGGRSSCNRESEIFSLQKKACQLTQEIASLRIQLPLRLLQLLHQKLDSRLLPPHISQPNL